MEVLVLNINDKKEDNSKLPKKIYENKKVTIKYPDDVNQNLKRTIENFIFLSIIAASAILISGIGFKKLTLLIS